MALGQNLIALVNIKIAGIYDSVHPTKIDNSRFWHTPKWPPASCSFSKPPLHRGSQLWFNCVVGGFTPMVPQSWGYPLIIWANWKDSPFWESPRFRLGHFQVRKLWVIPRSGLTQLSGCHGTSPLPPRLPRDPPENFPLPGHRQPAEHLPLPWHNYNWLVVSPPLKNISQLGWLFSIYGKIKNVPNHQPDDHSDSWHSSGGHWAAPAATWPVAGFTTSGAELLRSMDRWINRPQLEKVSYCGSIVLLDVQVWNIILWILSHYIIQLSNYGIYFPIVSWRSYYGISNQDLLAHCPM